MYVAVPIREKASDGMGAIVGAVSVGKPVQSFGPFVEAARRKVERSARRARSARNRR
jgi:two-component system sensor histidine kinase CreC